MAQAYQGQPPQAYQQPQMAQAYQGQPQMAQPYVGQPAFGAPMAQPYPQATLQSQPYATLQSQPYATLPGQVQYVQYPGQPVMAAPYPAVAVVLQPAPAADTALPAGTACMRCRNVLQGLCFRCSGCKNNGRIYALCVTCHSQTPVEAKSLTDELSFEIGSLRYNYGQERPHEKWHPYERAMGLQPLPVAASAAPRLPVRLTISCNNLTRTSGFGLSKPNPHVMVSAGGRELLATEERKGTGNPEFNRTLDLWNDDVKLDFTVYDGSDKTGVVSLMLSEVLTAVGARFTKSFNDPKTGYRLSSGVLIIRWAVLQQQAVAPVVAPPPYGGK